MKLLSYKETKHINLNAIYDTDIFANIGNRQTTITLYGGSHIKVIFLAFCGMYDYETFNITINSDTYVKIYFRTSKQVMLNIKHYYPEISKSYINTQHYDYGLLKIHKFQRNSKVIQFGDMKANKKFIIPYDDLEYVNNLVVSNENGVNHKEYTVVVFNQCALNIIFDAFSAGTIINIYALVECALHVPHGLTINYFSGKKLNGNMRSRFDKSFIY